MKKTVKTLSLLLCLLFMFSVVLPAANGINTAEPGKTAIINPYENIDWSAVRGYKTALHTHTNASDGVPTLK
jgi:hypothetical protein